MTRARLGRTSLGLAALAAVAIAVAGVQARLRPDPADLLVRAQADYRAGHYGAAEAGPERLARLRTPTPMDRIARALVARARGRSAAALAELDRIPDDDSLAPLARLLAGQIELARGRARPAEAHFLAALARDRGLAQAHRELVYVYSVQRRLDELDEQMDALSRLDALGFDYLLHWGKTRNVVWNPGPDCEALARFVAADPEDRASRLARADGLRQLGRLDEAGAVLAPLPDSDPEARARRALLALDRGAMQQAECLLAAGPDDHAGLARVRGQLALGRGDPGRAAQHFRLALAAAPDDRAVLGALGTALRLAGDPRRARPYLDAARRHDALTPLIAEAATRAGARDPKLPARLGAACEAAGRLAEARAWYRRAIAHDPLDPGAQRALLRLGRGPLGGARSGRDPAGGPTREAMADTGPAR
jgi:tetratricopeptide (TPR) repeat protein